MLILALVFLFIYTFYIVNECSIKTFKQELTFNLMFCRLLLRNNNINNSHHQQRILTNNEYEQMVYEQQRKRLYNLDDDFCGNNFKNWNLSIDKWELDDENMIVLENSINSNISNSSSSSNSSCCINNNFNNTSTTTTNTSNNSDNGNEATSNQCNDNNNHQKEINK